MTGETTDISEYLDFGFYDHVSYKENDGIGMTAIGKWIGVSHRVDGLMSYYNMTQKVMAISITKVQQITSIEKETEKVKAGVSEFDTDVNLRFKEEEELNYDGSKPNPEDWSEYLKYDPYF